MYETPTRLRYSSAERRVKSSTSDRAKSTSARVIVPISRCTCSSGRLHCGVWVSHAFAHTTCVCHRYQPSCWPRASTTGSSAYWTLRNVLSLS